MSHGPSLGGGLKAELNVTPLVDVVLVLLIIFMVVTPMMHKGPAVELPRAGTSEKSQPGGGAPMVLSVTREQRLFLGDDEVDLPQLTARIRAHLGANPNAEVVVQGDRRLRFKHVQQVLDACSAAGARRLAVATQEAKKGS
ncbi:MAG: biopolymer transporter ExbD [Myxococcota bacterium]